MIYECFDQELGTKIAADLLRIEAIKLSPERPFTWASGWKSPIYCDNRLSLSFPDVRLKITKAFAMLVKDRYKDAGAIAGVATAGIPQGALLAAELDLPFIYVRSSSKSHGLTNQIEGKVIQGQKVVVLEDLVSTGGSSLSAVDALRTANVNVLGMTSIFNYGFEIARQNFQAKHVDLVYLSEYELMIRQAVTSGIIGQDMVARLQEWRKDPANWS